MDGQRTSAALLERTSTDVVQLLKRFENIVALAPNQEKDRNATAVHVYQMEVETAALIRVAEDLLSLTRFLKEEWLFGKLDTIRRRDSIDRTVEKDTWAVGEMMQQLIKNKDEL